jgi:hypothetical protein
MMQVQIGRYVVSYDSEQFRIFPKNAKGETVPVWRINHFLYLRCAATGQLTVFKRYLHMKSWYWRDSRDPRPVSEAAVVGEVARMLFRGDESHARDLLVAVLTGGDLAGLALAAA